MAFYIYRPSACPACNTSGAGLIERNYTPAPGMHLVSYHCPRCQWMVEGKDPSYIGTASLAPLLLASSFTDFSEVDEPMRRHSNPPLTHEMLTSRAVSDHLSPYSDHLRTDLA